MYVHVFHIELCSVTAVYWFGYEYLKALQLAQAGNTNAGPTLAQCFISGAVSGTVSSVSARSAVVWSFVENCTFDTDVKPNIS